MHWRQALTEEELLERELQTRNQAKIVQMIKDLTIIDNVDIEVDEFRIHLLWTGKGEGEFTDVIFDKEGNVVFTNDETIAPLDINIGPFMGESLYNYVIKRKHLGR